MQAVPPQTDQTLYESERTSLPWKLFVSVATGISVVVFMSFVRWFSREAAFGTATAPMIALGIGVALVMCGAALRSRVVRALTFSEDWSSLIFFQDPASMNSVALVDIVTATSETATGGWSRDPADVLVLTLRDGSIRRFELPDDADTPAIASEIRSRLHPHMPS